MPREVGYQAGDHGELAISFGYEDIKPYIEQKLISEQTHPENPLVKIFNYTQKCQFDGAWDTITKQCRGLIMNIETSEILARPFEKFFNYGEYISKGWPLPKGTPIVTEKLDGSLGILYELNDKLWIATRGAFTSDQSVWATKWFRENYKYFVLPKNTTLLWEIIYPENRIVVNYDFSALVLLSMIDNKTGLEMFVGFDGVFLPPYKIKKVKKMSITNLNTLSAMDEPNSEGFVLYYPESNERMKIKFPEYVRLHKLVTGVSEIAIWEYMKEGKDLNDLLEKVPDEFYKWVHTVQNRLRAEHAKIWGEANFGVLMAYGLKTRKEKAMFLLKEYKEVSGIAFSILDGEDKKAVQQAWKMVRPHGNSQFKNDLDA